MSEQFESLSVIELRQKAKEMGVKLGAGINKQGIVEKLKEAAARIAPAPEEAPDSTPATEESQQTSMLEPVRPVRSAAIITDDEEMDEDVPVLTPNPASRSTPRMVSRPINPPAPSAAPAGSSLSTISAKAPAFTMEGSRAWHNPRAYQNPNNNFQRPQANTGWNRPAAPTVPDQRTYTRPDPRMQQQRPVQQPAYVNRFGPEQPPVQQEQEPTYRVYTAPQQDYGMPRENPAPNQGGYGYNQPGYTAHREQPVNSATALSDILAAGDCGDGEGVLEVHPDGYGFLRTNHYLPGKQDVYISNAQIRRFALRTGDYVVGKTRPQRDTERYSAMLYITEVNGAIPEEMPTRARFDELTPIYPKKKITLQTRKDCDPALRLLDILSPIGFGQRAMLQCTSRVDRLALLNKLAAVIGKNYPKAQLMMLLLDERPEEVTEIRESFKGEVAYATFDEPAENQVRVAELALERAMRLTEQKKDVIILADSLTRLGRASNAAAPAVARTLPNGLAAGAMNKPKRFFGAARNTREGGSLTIIATVLAEGSSELDNAILQSFQGNGNMTCALDQPMKNQPIVFQPAQCATIHDEWLLTEAEMAQAEKLREKTRELSAPDAMNAMLEMLEQADKTDE